MGRSCRKIPSSWFNNDSTLHISRKIVIGRLVSGSMYYSLYIFCTEHLRSADDDLSFDFGSVWLHFGLETLFNSLT